MILEVLGEGSPTRLFVSGLHGGEHKTTDPILRKFCKIISDFKIEGKTIFSSLGKINQEYVSTLKKDYFETEAGKKLISIIESHKPSIYLELHSYSNYSHLTDNNRMEKEGVPPLVDLGSGILAGSVSPHLRKKFRKDDFCFLLDVPKEEGINEELLKIMKIIVSGNDRLEIFQNLSIEYPDQMEQMMKNYLEFYGDAD